MVVLAMAVGLLWLLVAAPRAAAAPSQPVPVPPPPAPGSPAPGGQLAGTWEGRWSAMPPPTSFAGSSIDLGGWFRYTGPPSRQITRITFDVVPTTVPPGCPTSPASAPPADRPTARSDGSVPFAFSVPVACNGRYRVMATAVADNVLFGRSTWRMEIPAADVMAAPPPVTNVTSAVAPDRSVIVAWGPPAGYGSGAPADFMGYRVTRSGGGSGAQTIAAVGPSQRAIRDPRPPAGRVMYQVVALRWSPAGPVPSAAIARVASVGAGAGGPARSSPGSAAGAAPAPSGTPSAGAPSETTLTVPEGRPLPPLSDGGGPGEAASLTVEASDAPAARAVLVPTAAGLAILMWALHGRLLARAARSSASG
jgi:hypothetical protein